MKKKEVGFVFLMIVKTDIFVKEIKKKNNVYMVVV
jgi:hypothetical protein